MPELDGKIAVVTGATGGLGGAVVAALLEAGAAVYAPHRRADDLERLRAALGLPGDAALSGALLDLTNEEAVRRSYAELAARHGGIDILVNVAGGFAGGKPVHETDWALWQAQLDINLKTAVVSSAAAVPHLLARGGGAIVNVSSRTAAQAGAFVAAYGASKRAVVGLTEAMAAELRDQNITVNAVLPSVIDTPANRSRSKADPAAWVQPAEIARVVRFLAGPDARIISGAALPVYGRA